MKASYVHESKRAFLRLMLSYSLEEFGNGKPPCADDGG